MSITKELAERMNDSPAVVCCRTTKGTVIAPVDLEDPSLLPGMEESGYLSVASNTLTIGDALGGKLLCDVDGLTCLTCDIVKCVVKREGNAPAAAPQLQTRGKKGGQGVP